ncbi:MAG TPA: T9SS type A sorting domain-containing protein, partial [Phaeodactylibacter sp.]|nr:T9SS type A sorting domain-containing protein [Phaeodactylibacter sp.]
YIGTDYSSPYSAYWHPLVAGSYYVDVKATDNEGFVKYDHVQFQVGQTITHCTQIIQSSDDAEQRQNGSINLTSGDIELIEDNNKDQIVGLRFTGLNIPHGAAISKAHLQFEVKDNTNENPCVLNIYGQKGSNPLTFSSNPNDISNRTKTDNYATWSPPTWNNNDPPRSSSNLQEVLQEIVMQDEYNPDQAIVLIIEGIGARNAISFDQGNGSKAPLLCVTFDADNCYDTDFDGTCDIDDICLPGPEPGQPCNDGDSSTSNDAINNDCECVGIHYDCPDLQMQFGNPCDDNNPYTCQDIITFNCDCVGIPTNGDLVLSIPILHDNHDAEERSNGSVSTSSSDLELVKDNSTQVVGLFFQNPGVPAGTELTEAFVQFTVDEKKNSNPCVLTIFGELNSNASAFASSTYNISDRNKTNASITWSPDNWDSVNDQGADQRTPNIAPILQEIINRNGYSPNTPFVLIIEGSGKRVAFSHDKDPDKAPVLSIAFENNITEDSDGDGICDEEDLCFGANPGTPCNDNNPATYEDMIDNDCNCTGTPYDCPELLANIGDSCDDGDPLTFNDVLYADCACAGSSLVPVEICSRVSKKQDDAEEKSNGNCSTTSSDLELVDDKGNNQLVGVRFRNIHLPQGTTIESAYLQFTVDALNDEDPCELIIHGELAPNPAVFKKKKHNISDRDLTNASVQWSPEAWTNVGDDGPAQRSTDIGSIIQEIVNQEGFDEDSPIVLILSGEGTREAESREGGANKAPELCVTLLMPPNTEAIASNNLGLAEDTPRDRQSAGNVAGAHLAKASTKYTDHKPLASFLDIHPNPASSELKAIFDMNAPTEAFISILDINGYMLSQKKYAVIAGTNRVTMDIANLPNGLYFITLQTNAERRIAKFSILHQNQ